MRSIQSCAVCAVEWQAPAAAYAAACWLCGGPGEFGPWRYPGGKGLAWTSTAEMVPVEWADEDLDEVSGF